MAILLARRVLRGTVQRNLCIHCGYELADLWPDAIRCPECGHSCCGHVVAAAQGRHATQLIDFGAWALLWWVMISLAAIGMVLVFAATVAGICASIS